MSRKSSTASLRRRRTLAEKEVPTIDDNTSLTHTATNEQDGRPAPASPSFSAPPVALQPPAVNLQLNAQAPQAPQPPTVGPKEKQPARSRSPDPPLPVDLEDSIGSERHLIASGRRIIQIDLGDSSHRSRSASPSRRSKSPHRRSQSPRRVIDLVDDDDDDDADARAPHRSSVHHSNPSSRSFRSKHHARELFTGILKGPLHESHFRHDSNPAPMPLLRAASEIMAQDPRTAHLRQRILTAGPLQLVVLSVCHALYRSFRAYFTRRVKAIALKLYSKEQLRNLSRNQGAAIAACHLLGREPTAHEIERTLHILHGLGTDHGSSTEAYSDGGDSSGLDI